MPFGNTSYCILFSSVIIIFKTLRQIGIENRNATTSAAATYLDSVRPKKCTSNNSAGTKNKNCLDIAVKVAAFALPMV